MRRGNIVVLLVAIVMGGVAAFMARTWLQRQTVQPTQASTVVVAVRPLGFGTVLNVDNVAEIPWSGPPLPTVFATKDELLKEGRRVVLMPIDRNEPVFRS